MGSVHAWCYSFISSIDLIFSKQHDRAKITLLYTETLSQHPQTIRLSLIYLFKREAPKPST